MAFLPNLVRRARTTNPYVVDSAVALAVAVPMSVPFITPSPGVTLLGGVLNAATVVPLIWRRRAPFTVAVVVMIFAALMSLYHHPGQMLQYSGLVVFYTIADLGRRWQRLSILWLVLLTFPPAAILLKHNSPAEFMFTLLLPLAAYLVGTVARTNRARTQTVADYAAELERRREADTARAAAEERTRIARDMHDVLAHAVSVMVVQAEAGPVVVRSDPARAERAFDVIAEAGRSAMVQLSQSLGLLRDDRAGAPVPHPTLAGIPSLVDQVRQAGRPIDLRTEGTPRPVPADTETAAYRIVQEALTNTLKHGGPGPVQVRLNWHRDLRITVTDHGPGQRAAVESGRGLIGIRERAEACGGQADAGPTPTGFRVSAHLPVAV